MSRFLAAAMIASAAFLVTVAYSQKPVKKAPPVKYTKVEALMKKRCVGCHHGEGAAGKLDLSSYKGLMAGGEHGKVVVAGKSGKSALMDYLTGKKKPQMPMADKPLSKADIAVVSGWIDGGAKSK